MGFFSDELLDNVYFQKYAYNNRNIRFFYCKVDNWAVYKPLNIYKIRNLGYYFLILLYIFSFIIII